ncbi:DeoR/GlpR family DNA-binding transcription regulator [Flavimaricola marinus]|uniref:Glycerol-3-phosphate regulon repressor n=1 Tax=Flavimaricola marinus TaxID=1819565 RepID=A0A238LF40_9RHOB|nr:DeoR/GlpR family DNA-binding transcription regulator [Flavimaricola marinus]SMY07520.1 Glycerol-3-phosphate regulon repressor [Flavimaricola marinus]
METQKNHTQQAILQALRKAGGSLRISALADTLDVSEETIRRNVKRLERTGTVEKLHGGARLRELEDEGDFRDRLQRNPDAKQRIARAVAALLPDDCSIFLDIGSTTAFIADALRDHQNLVVVTNSISVAYKLATRNGNRVFMAGGELRAHDGGAFGSEAMAFANNFKTDYAILSAAALNAIDGLMLFDLEEALFSRAILTNAGRRIVAADSSKFNRRAPITVCAPQMIDLIVTDALPPTEVRMAAEVWGTEIKIAT